MSDCSYARTHVPPGGRVLYGGPAPRRGSTVNRSYAPYYYGTKPIAGATSVDPRAGYYVRGSDGARVIRRPGTDARVRPDDRVTNRAGKANRKWKHDARNDAKHEWKDEKDHGHGKHHD